MVFQISLFLLAVNFGFTIIAKFNKIKIIFYKIVLNGVKIMFLSLTNCVVIPWTCVNVVNIETITNRNDQNVVHYNTIYRG